MKFLAWSTIICIASFSLSAIFYGYADFTGVTKDFKSGKYNWSYSAGGGGIDSDKDYGVKVETYDASLVKKIEIKSSISKVVVSSKATEKIKVKVRFLNEGVEKTYRSKLESGVLKIDTGEDSDNQSITSFFGSKKNGCEIDVLIPKGLELNFDFKLALGSLEIKNLETGDFKAKLAAGNIEAKNINFGSAVIRAAAGNIELENIKVAKKMKIDAAAGNIEVELNQADPNLEINAAAGNIELSFSEGIEPDLSFKSLTTVGDLSVRKDFKSLDDSTYVFGSGKGKIDVKSTFGNVDFD